MAKNLVKINSAFGRLAFDEAKSAVEAGGDPEGIALAMISAAFQIAALHRGADRGIALLDAGRERASAVIAAADRAGAN